ncbi:uncharacterized protein LOC129948551 [Eupeodes corollae]|uniref:uncharacterized protein LOC129948551 n=1 Tax=Eupeodes corollae TaxID=290404 RepID=UPI00249144A6|nr:uncharacterized protein LOC129948551 [Eupeodes corollae]
MTVNDSQTSSRLFITDKTSKLQFLVDTGSDVSVFPHTGSRQKSKPSDYTLFAANGTPIPTYGFRTLQMNLGLRRDFTWRFVVAEVSKPIIGADFLAFYQLLVDVSHSRLLDGITGLSALGCHAFEMSSHVKSVSGTSKYIELLKKYPSLTRPDGSFKEIRHSTVHHINTKAGPPVSCKSRR